MQRDFEAPATFIGMSWLKYAVTFQRQWDFEVRRGFEELSTSVSVIKINPPYNDKLSITFMVLPHLI